MRRKPPAASASEATPLAPWRRRCGRGVHRHMASFTLVDVPSLAMLRGLRILESNYGRDFGWFVEVEGRAVAVLTDCQWADIFWDSYRVDVLDDGDEFFTDAFWDRCDRLAFRNREFGDVASLAFPCGHAGSMLKDTGRILVRRCYLDLRRYPWD